MKMKQKFLKYKQVQGEKSQGEKSDSWVYSYTTAMRCSGIFYSCAYL